MLRAMRVPRFEITRELLVLLALAGLPQFAAAYTYLQVGVDSNFLVDDRRVIFAQADRSLTVLALDNGKVLRREKSRDYSGTFQRTGHGILLFGSDRITMLDPMNFTTRWETPFHSAPNVIGNDLVSYDGNGRVQCRGLADGRVRWSYHLPGALQVVAASGAVLVHHGAIYDEEFPAATALVDLQTGNELFRKGPPFGTNWASMYFDGTNIYAEVGPYDEKRSNYKPDRLAVWNRGGEEINSQRTE